MGIYTSFWKNHLAFVKKQIKSAEANEFVVNNSGLANLGDRGEYNGYAKFWIGKEVKFTRSAVFRDLIKALNNDKNRYLNNAIGLLEIRVEKNNHIFTKYQPITFDLILNQYEKLQENDNYLDKEVYKWELVELFQNQWNKYENKEISFVELFNSLKFENLIYTTCISIYKHIVQENAREFEELINYLFDETLELQERITNYRKRFDILYYAIPNHGMNTYEEERTLATWLTFRYPEKYTFYKDEFYTKLCKGLGIQVQKPLFKLAHYYTLINDFTLNYLNKRDALIENNKNKLNQNCNIDLNNLILAQDILYTTLVTNNPIESHYESEDESIEQRHNSNHIKMNNPLNQILYGPPGTGKTYNTINRAIAIANPDFDLEQSRLLIKEEFERLKTAGQIEFTTFHQSMSYEDFIEGIKPQLEGENDSSVNYIIQPGIFKQLCDKAIVSRIKSFDEVYQKILNKIENSENDELELKTPTGKPFWLKINSNSNLSLYTGKTKLKNGVIKKESLAAEANGEIIFLGWESYSLGIFNYLKSEFEFDKNEKIIDTKPYVLIIDEINRGNVSQIFGELITLIEEDKRIGKDEFLEVMLPYSKKKFGVPPNLHIIGTMNTADRSVEALDTALRRRFSFIEMPPNIEPLTPLNSLLRLWEKYAQLKWEDEKWKQIERAFFAFSGLEMFDEVKYKSIYDRNEANEKRNYDEAFRFSEGIDMSLVLAKINGRILKLLDKDHQIGHAFFMNVFSIEELKSVFENKIIPLLQEYFYGDFGKIGLVLGNSFIKKDEAIDDFAPFDHYDQSLREDLSKTCYQFTNKSAWDFKSI